MLCKFNWFTVASTRMQQSIYIIQNVNNKFIIHIYLPTILCVCKILNYYFISKTGYSEYSIQWYQIDRGSEKSQSQPGPKVLRSNFERSTDVVPKVYFALYRCKAFFYVFRISLSLSLSHSLSLSLSPPPPRHCHPSNKLQFKVEGRISCII